MQQQTDAELLRDYATNHSETAFGEIVRRYADAIYSAALRQVGNEEQARDVAQTVFVDLARKAVSLNANTLLIGWLYRGTRLAALEQLRTDLRRQHRERQAMEFFDPSPETADDWNAVRPVLDEAIANLGNEDRDALLLRFFKNENLATVGASLGVSEDAAQKRVSRALGKLREFLEQRGIKTTAAALSAVLTANAVQSAPIGFAASLVTGALAKATIAGSSTTPLLKLFTFTNMKTAILILTLAGGIAGITAVRVQSQHRLQETQALIEQQSQAIEALRADNEKLAGLTNEIARWRSDAQDVLRLRGEVTRLQRENATQKPIAARPEAAAAQANARTNAAAPQINVEARFVTLPTEALKALGSAGLPALRSGVITTLADHQLKTIWEALKGASDANVLGNPQVTTLGGRPCVVSVTKSVPSGNTNVQLGISLDVTPEFLAPRFHLGLVGRLTQLVDVSPGNDGSKIVLEKLEIPANVNLLEDQSVVLVKDILHEGNMGIIESTSLSEEPKTLLIFVKPTLIDAAGNRYTDRLVVEIRKADTNSLSGKNVSTPPTP